MASPSPASPITACERPLVALAGSARAVARPIGVAVAALASGGLRPLVAGEEGVPVTVFGAVGGLGVVGWRVLRCPACVWPPDVAPGLRITVSSGSS